MSHPIIKRKRTESLKSKIYSQQSGNVVPRHSLGRILNDSLSKRRRTTHNSPDQSQDLQQQMQTQIEQAKQIYRNKNTKNALILFRKLYKKYPNNSQIPYFIGSCLLNENSFDQALTYFKACLSSNPNFNKNIYICIAICNKALGQFNEAIQILDIACQKYQKFSQAFFYKGKMLMKQSQYQQACQTFRKCIKIDPKNDISHLFLGDCLRNLGKFEQAIQKYNYVIKQGEKLVQKALIKKIYSLIDWKKIHQAQKQINKILNKGIQSPELNFLKGLCQYERGNFNDAITLFQLTLTSNIGQTNTIKALKYLIQIRVKEKDFFGAEHLVSRSKFININQKDLQPYYVLVEGINDLIKRRLIQSQQKLQQVYNGSIKQINQSQRFIHQASSPYYAFCLFNIEKYEKSIEIYKRLMKNMNKHKQGQKKVQCFNSLICQGIVLHKKNKYKSAEQKFRQASKLFQKKVQPIFLICVNSVQEYKQKINLQQDLKSKLISKLQAEFTMTEDLNCHTPLFLFYMSLAYLYQGKDARTIIDKAIAMSQQQVSQYFFIQALCYSVKGQNMKGLQSITKAIQLDHNIPQFFKQRSKYYYVLQRYQQAVSDILKIMQQNQDQQAKLLLTFYYYMTNQIGMSLQILKQVSQHCSQDKFKQFQTALYFRIHQYDKCGIVGNIINSIINKKQLNQNILQCFLKQYIKQRQSYSQFTVYHFYLILAAYYFYNKQLDYCLQNLFGALQQLQLNSQTDQYLNSTNQLLLNQIKYNIAISSLIKQIQEKKQITQQKQKQNKLEDTFKYIDMFISETQDLQFIKVMNIILIAIDKNNGINTNKIIPNIIDLYVNQPKLSDDFPEIQIFSTYPLKTKFLITYPIKLKFNISPQFDQSFLYNFDVDKVQSKLCPPWFKLHEGHIFFTDKIRNQSVMISETQRAPTPSLLSPTPIPQNLKQKFKLDDAVEKKLQRFIHIRKKKQQQASKNEV